MKPHEMIQILLDEAAELRRFATLNPDELSANDSIMEAQGKEAAAFSLLRTHWLELRERFA